MSLRIAILSDVHSEFYPANWLPPLPQPTECDVLVLAGDIAVGDGAIDFVTQVADVMSDTPVLWVAGNHEFYGQDYDRQLSRYQSTFEDCEHVHFLERDAVTIGGVTFLGTTLWTGFDALGEDISHQGKEVAGRNIADFFRIQKDDNRRLFTTADAAALFEENYRWLGQSLKENQPDRTVVVTHFPPIGAARHPGFPEDELTTYFQADCESLIEQYQPSCWVYGHNHWSDRHLVNTTRLVSNQLGYPGEDGIPGAEILIVEV